MIKILNIPTLHSVRILGAISPKTMKDENHFSKAKSQPQQIIIIQVQNQTRNELVRTSLVYFIFENTF